MSADGVQGKRHRCVYCGWPARHVVLGVRVCHAHSDLPRLDPAFADRTGKAPSQWKAAA